MTNEEARAHVGSAVLYKDERTGATEEGIIMSANQVYVFVRYGANQHTEATLAESLTLLRPS